MSIFTRLYSSLTGKSYNDVIMPTWDSIDLPNRGSSLRRSQTQFLNYNRINLYVNRAIEKRAEKVSQVEWVLKKGDRVIENHPILELLNRPNSHHTGRQFIRALQKHRDITGNAFIYTHTERRELFGSPSSELHLLRPDCVTIKWDGAEIAGYDYRVDRTSDFVHYDAEQVLYYFNPDPMRLLEGESLLAAGIRQMDTENQLADYHSHILKNGGKVDTVVSFKEQINSQQISELKEQFAAKYAEAARAGAPMFLGGDAKIDRLQLNPAELAYLESKKVTLQDICLMTGVPRSILSQGSEETYANAETSYAIFLRETIKPLLEDLTTFLNYRLVPEDLELKFIDPTPEDIDRKAKYLQTAHQIGALTTNEKREHLEMEPIGTEGDTILVPINMVPLGEETSTSEETADPEERSAPRIAHPLRDEATRRRYEKIMLRRYDRREQRLEKAITGYFTEQQKRLTSHITDVRTYRRKDLFGEAFDYTVELKLAEETLLPFIREIVEESGQQAMALAGSSEQFVLGDNIRSWLDERKRLFAEQVTGTTFEKLQREFEESLSSGENRQELIARIQNVYDGYTEGRARTIARTEVHNATQQGTFVGYKQAGMPIKIWVTVGDLNVRDAHRIDGQERPIDMPFDVGGEKLMYPGDTSGSAGNTVNCRCTI